MMTIREEEKSLREQAEIYEQTLIFWFARVDKLIADLDASETSFEPDEKIRDDLELACSKLHYELAIMPIIEKKIDDFINRAKER